VSVRPITVSNVWMMGVLNNDWEGIRKEEVVAKFKNCVYFYLEVLRKTINLHSG
jgi:hypothetical protein